MVKRISTIATIGLAFAVMAGPPPVPTPNPLGSVTLAWTASTSDTNASNPYVYIVGYGSTSGNYPNSLNAGTNLSLTISNLVPGTYYFVAMAQDTNASLVSPYSTPTNWTAPSQPSPPTGVTLHIITE